MFKQLLPCMFLATARRFNFLSIVRHKIKDSVPNSIKLKFLCFPIFVFEIFQAVLRWGYLPLNYSVCLLCLCSEFWRFIMHIQIAHTYFRRRLLSTRCTLVLKFLIILKQNFPIPWESIGKKTKIVSFPSTKTIYGPILLNVINGTFREIRMYVKMSTWNRMPVYAI